MEEEEAGERRRCKLEHILNWFIEMFVC